MLMMLPVYPNILPKYGIHAGYYIRTFGQNNSQ